MWETGDACAEREKSTMLKQAGPIGGGKKREEKGKRKRRRRPGQTDGLGQLGQARKKEKSKKKGEGSMRGTAGPGCCWAVGPAWFLFSSLNQMLVMNLSNFDSNSYKTNKINVKILN